MDKKSEVISNVFDCLVKLVPHAIKNIETPKSLEIKNKNRIYENIAEFLRDKYGGGGNKATYMSAAYMLCKELSPDFAIEKTSIGESKVLVEKAEKNILTIKLHYKISNPSDEIICITEIYYLENGGPCVSRVKESMSWDNLPGQVKDYNMKSKSSEISLSIFPA